MAPRFVAVQNMLPNKTRVMFGGEIFPFEKGEIRILTDEVGHHALKQFVHLPKEVKGPRGEMQTIAVPYKKFKRISLEDAFKAGIKMEENPQIAQVQKNIEETAAMKAKMRAEVRQEVLAELRAEAAAEIEQESKEKGAGKK